MNASELHTLFEKLASGEIDAATAQRCVLDALRADAAAYIAYRGLQQQGSRTRQIAERILREAKTLSRTAASRADLLQAMIDAGERLGPGVDEPVTRYVEILATVPAAVVRPAEVAAAPKTPAAR